MKCDGCGKTKGRKQIVYTGQLTKKKYAFHNETCEYLYQQKILKEEAKNAKKNT